MFGLLLSGRLVDTNFTQVDATHVVIEIDNIETANHVVVFLTGQQSFPAGMGGAVYFAWPSTEPNGQPLWQFLGTLSNTKPSAIFKIARAKKVDSVERSEMLVAKFGGAGNGNLPGVLKAQLGISMEPLTHLGGMTPDSQAEASTIPSFMEFSQKMVENLFNYASSFAVSPAEVMSRQGETFISYTTLQNWYKNFERRLQQNPQFWKN